MIDTEYHGSDTEELTCCIYCMVVNSSDSEDTRAITDELIEGHKIIKIKIGEFEFMLIAENGSVFDNS